MKIYILIFIFLISCMNKKNQENTRSYKVGVDKLFTAKPNKKKVVKLIKNDTLVILLKRIKYKLLDIRLNNVSKRELVILKNNSIKHKIKLLTGEDQMGFSINWIKDIGQGFEISVEFGKYYFERNFEFIYENNSFYLTKIETFSIDYKNNNNIKKENNVFDKSINIDDFRMENFIK